MVTNLKGTKLISVRLKKIDWNKRVASDLQFSFKSFIRPYWENAIGVSEEFVIPKSGGLRIDLINFSSKVIFEISGKQHFSYCKFFHAGNPLNFAASIKRDCLKHDWAMLNGFSWGEVIESDIPLLSPDYIKKKFGIEI